MTTQSNTKSDNIEDLRSAVYEMDCLAQHVLSEISAIAKLALLSLETPYVYRNPEIIAQALYAILGSSEGIMNCINSEAENVGCNYTDPKAELRHVAKRAASKEKNDAENVKEEV